MTPLSQRMAAIKWDGSKPYFGQYWTPMTVVDDTLSPKTGTVYSYYHVDGTAFAYYGLALPMFIPDARLIECVVYEDQMMHLFGINQQGSKIDIRFHGLQTYPRATVGVALVATDTEPYRSQVLDALEHYTALPNVDSVHVAYYADRTGLGFVTHGKTVVSLRPLPEFSMAKARNASFSLCRGDQVLVSDLDYRYTAEQITEMQTILATQPSHGVLQLKATPQSGNGNYFGERAIMAKNTYDERFQGCWREDTEYLMNFSRLGILPLTIIRSEYLHPAQKHAKAPMPDANFDLMKQIIYQGR